MTKLLLSQPLLSDQPVTNPRAASDQPRNGRLRIFVAPSDDWYAAPIMWCVVVQAPPGRWRDRRSLQYLTMSSFRLHISPMGYFDSKRNVDAYVRMADGYDGSVLVAVLERHLPAGASVLEIGMGPGKDLHLLRRRFHPTGSDRSAIFVDHVRAAQPEADVLLLDAVTMQTDRRFDAVYSNKVLHQLTRDELVRSLHSQRRVLNSGGIAVHGLCTGTASKRIAAGRASTTRVRRSPRPRGSCSRSSIPARTWKIPPTTPCTSSCGARRRTAHGGPLRRVRHRRPHRPRQVTRVDRPDRA